MLDNNKKEMLKELSLNLKFKLNDEQLEKLDSEFEFITNKISLLDKINVDNVEPTFYNAEASATELREDNPIQVSNPDEYIKNSNYKKERYIVIK
jgi:aspartyl/glutamyl-tRNA(Asn/Gln) amidotransferase C subunit